MNVDQTTMPLSQPCPSPAAPLGAALGLVWVFPNQQPVMSPLEGSRMRIGRAREAELRIEVENVSRFHAEVVRSGPVWVLRDLRSRNGTFCDGSPVTETPLYAGRIVRLGGAIAVVTDFGGSRGEGLFSEHAPGLWGGARFASVLRSAELFARSVLPMILQGPTGTGKEHIARAVHQWSGRAGPFVAINCGALPVHLAEAELFGHRRGAFTGAEKRSLGHFGCADRGTLFLDEIVELPPAVQTKLLRAVECGEITSLGESLGRKVDVRVLCAAQEPLEDKVRQGAFREDLLARLSGCVLTIPPLSERREDIPQLFACFLSRASGGHPPELDVRFVEALCLHAWPRNVRQLEMSAKRLAIVAGHESRLTMAHAEGLLPQSSEESPARQQSSRSSVSPELARLHEALRAYGGNLKRAAGALGISRQRAYRLMTAHPEVSLTSLRGKSQ